jgi:transcriptional regulator with XRE-family HTH domain
VNVVPHQRTLDGRAQSLDSAADRIAFGELLRGARERCGITLQQIASETKIPQRHLESLERGQLTATPGGTYTRGEVIAYANVVRLDRQIALAHLERALQPAAETRSTAAPLRPDASRTRGRRTAIVAGAGTVILALVAWSAMFLDFSSAARSLELESESAPIGAPSSPAAPAVASEVTAPSRARATSGVASAVGAGIVRTTPVAQPDQAVNETAQARHDFPPRLVIVSDPVGARVTVDGIGRGLTPLFVNELSPGARRIRVTLAGYRAADVTVPLRATGDTTVNIVLHPTGQPEPPPKP